MRRSADTRGFTLVEILVALAVIAIALAAIMHNFNQGIDTTVALRDRTVALWVAQNRLAIHYATHTWPSPTVTDGVTEMAGRNWYWREQVMSTADPDMRRIEITVDTKPGNDHISRLVGFLGKPESAQ
jgi:general secretion pathway protein I